MQQISINADEAILKGAQDGLFFSHFFLEKSFKLEPAVYHREIWDTLDDVNNRFVCLEVHRDGAKTTILRAFALRGVCYGIYRTIMFLSESSAHSKRSLSWLRRRVLGTKKLVKTFGLKIGEKNNTEELEIISTVYKTKTTIIAQGIFGQIRGVNEDDDRPDLIICDDICSQENTGSEEMQSRVNDIFFGAVLNSLAAKSMNPHGKLVHLGTRVGENDVIAKCQEDPQFICKKFPIFTEGGESAWPAKWSTEEAKLMKQSDTARNMLSTWMRERECKLIRSESTAFKAEWLQFYVIIPQQITYFIGVDPTPPPSERALASGLKRKDYEVHSVVGVSKGAYFLEHQEFNKGHEADWSIDTFFSLLQKYRPRAVGVEAVAYQRTLASLFRSEMQRRRTWFTQIIELDDRRKKFYRISDELNKIASNRMLNVRKEHGIFIQQFVEYPGCQHDDHLESVVFAIMTANQCFGYQMALDSDGLPDPYSLENDKNIPDLPQMTLCP